MKSRSAAFLFLPLLMLTSCSADVSAVPDGTIIPPETLIPYAEWVHAAMNVNMYPLPIMTASGKRLKTSMGFTGVRQERVIAAYLPGQIVFNNVAWDPRSLGSQSYLVHELVHHAQLMSDRPYPCDAAKEREAYTLQNRWLVEHGAKPMVSAEFIDKISACHDDKIGARLRNQE